MSEQDNSWHPPQEKYIRWAVNGLIGIGLTIGAVLLIKTFVPSINDAFSLLRKLTENMFMLALDVAGLLVLLFVLNETFSKNGSINKLFAQAYSSFVHNMTLELLNVDPMSPLKDSLTSVQEKKDEYDEAFAKFDAAIATFASREDGLNTDADHIEKQARAAQTSGQVQTFQQLAYKAGKERETAADIAKMRARLVPVREMIKRMQAEAADLIWKLGVDIETTQTKWEMANSMTAMDETARGFLKNNGKSDLAIEAQNLVQSKYSGAIGRLENLGDLSKALLDSTDLDKATYSQDLMDKWNAEANQGQGMITAQVSVLAPMSQVPATTGGFKGLI